MNTSCETARYYFLNYKKIFLVDAQLHSIKAVSLATYFSHLSCVLSFISRHYVDYCNLG
jgi:hypothetical protein